MVTVPEILKQSLSAPVKTMLLELTTENWTAFSELGEKMATPTNSNLAGNQAYSGTLELPHEKPINLKKETPEGSGKNSKSHYEDLFDSGSDFNLYIEFVEDGHKKKYLIHDRLLWSVTNKKLNTLTWNDQPGQLNTKDFENIIEPPTYRLFLHWLYHNKFAGPGDEDKIGYPQLIELYFLAVPWGITILQNVVIDSLISKMILEEKPIPSGWCKKIYQATSPGDQLRRLWVDFYAWDMDKDSFNNEKMKDLDPRFLRDLAVAQMELFRAGDRCNMSRPYETKPVTYHRADPVTGQCCCRVQFEGTKYAHRNQFYLATADTKHKTARKLSGDERLLKRRKSVID